MIAHDDVGDGDEEGDEAAVANFDQLIRRRRRRLEEVVVVDEWVRNRAKTIKRMHFLKEVRVT